MGKCLLTLNILFALIKYLDKNFDEKKNFQTKEASLNIIKPDWINK